MLNWRIIRPEPLFLEEMFGLAGAARDSKVARGKTVQGNIEGFSLPLLFSLPLDKGNIVVFLPSSPVDYP